METRGIRGGGDGRKRPRACWCGDPKPTASRFCSLACGRRYWSRRKAEREPATCAGCGSQFMALKHIRSKSWNRFCSNTCCAAHAKATGKFAGAQNPRWLGGVSTDNMRYRRRQQERNPVQEAARHAVKLAKRSGLLVRQPCEVCGADKAHAHHDDYSKPLEVRWLCSVHHDEHHRLMGDKHNGPRRVGSKAGTARGKVT